MKRAVSLATKAQVKGGGGFDDIDVEITGAIVKREDYTNKEGEVVASNVTVVAVTLKPLEGDAPEYTENYSVGAMVPSEDGEAEADEGEYLIPADSEKEFTGLTDSTRFGFFLAKLVGAGFPEAKLEANPSVKTIVGVKGHIRKVDPPKGSNSKRGIPVITKLITGSSSGGGTASSGGAAEKAATALILKVLEQKSPVTKMALGQTANKAFADKPVKAEAVKLVLFDQFLKKGAAEGKWVFDGRQVSKAVVAEESVDDIVVEVA